MPHPKIDRFVAYWHERRGTRAVPEKRAIDPVDIPLLLPNLILYDVVDGEPVDFMCRLAGEHVVVNYGHALRGLRLSEMIAGNPTLAPLRGNMLECLATRRPVVATDSFLALSGVAKRTEGAVVPLSSNGERVDLMLCCRVYLRQEGEDWIETNLF